MTEREQFEEWVRSSTAEVPHRDKYGFYEEPVSDWWKVWQAARAQPAQAGAEPDCRLCTHRQTWGESADPDCSLLSGCVNGSGYKPAIEIKLWRKE